MKTQKARKLTEPMRRALEATGIEDPCQLGGLQTIPADTMTDCRMIDPGQGKYGQAQGARRPWFDRVQGFQRMSCKGKRTFRDKYRDKCGKLTDTSCYAQVQEVGEHVVK